MGGFRPITQGDLRNAGTSWSVDWGQMALVRYKPGEAIRWLETHAEQTLKDAKAQGAKALQPNRERDVPHDLKEMAGALFGFGKGALAELVHRQLEATEYVLYDDQFEAISATGSRTALYKDVIGMKVKGDRCSVMLDRGKITIKPHAYIVSGSIKAPVGWSRNGMEVAYDTLLDELSARAGVNLERL